LALLTLFPIGALSMAQAIKDNRCQQAAAVAAAQASTLGLANDPQIFLAGNGLYIDGITPAPSLTTYGTLDLPSYPVYVDPFGAGSSVGTSGSTVIPRIPPYGFTTLIQRLNWFSLLDDLEFPGGAAGSGVAGSPVVRSNRYTWAYMLRRPRAADSNITE